LTNYQIMIRSAFSDLDWSALCATLCARELIITIIKCPALAQVQDTSFRLPWKMYFAK